MGIQKEGLQAAEDSHFFRMRLVYKIISVADAIHLRPLVSTTDLSSSPLEPEETYR